MRAKVCGGLALVNAFYAGVGLGLDRPVQYVCCALITGVWVLVKRMSFEEIERRERVS